MIDFVRVSFDRVIFCNFHGHRNHTKKKNGKTKIKKKNRKKMNKKSKSQKTENEIKMERNQVLHNCVVATILVDQLYSNCVNFDVCCFVVAVVARADDVTLSTNRK